MKGMRVGVIRETAAEPSVLADDAVQAEVNEPKVSVGRHRCRVLYGTQTGTATSQPQ